MSSRSSLHLYPRSTTPWGGSCVVEAFPGFDPIDRDLDDSDLEVPYLLFGYAGFADWVTDLLQDEPRDEALLRRVFDYIEQLASTVVAIRGLVATGFLEDVASAKGVCPEALADAKALMGLSASTCAPRPMPTRTNTLERFYATVPSPWPGETHI